MSEHEDSEAAKAFRSALERLRASAVSSQEAQRNLQASIEIMGLRLNDDTREWEASMDCCYPNWPDS